MSTRFALSAAAACLFAAAPAHAAVTLIATGAISGSAAGNGVDLATPTYSLENGLPQNVLGGIGSGLAYAGGTTFYATPDRGPNALAYNGMVDNTTSFISRFETLDLDLIATPSGGLPFKLGTKLTGTTLLYSSGTLNYGSGAGLGNDINGQPLQPGNFVNTSGKNYFTGRSDNYGSGGSENLADARFDPESIRVANDGKSVFVSDEYGPYVRQFDSATGALIRSYTLPSELYVATKAPTGAAEIASNTVGRTANKGMEGLAITPDGKTLVGIMQANLVNDPVGTVRIVTIDVAQGTTHEYLYKLTDGTGISDIVAVDATHFLIDERDGKGRGDGSKAKIKKVYMIDLSGATDVKGVITLSSLPIAPTYAQNKGIFLDVVAALKAYGIAPENIPSKIEGLAFGQDVIENGQTLHTLFIANDNDFDPAGSGPNVLYVFGFTNTDLPKFKPQELAVPEPGSWALMLAGFGVLGAALRRRDRGLAVTFA